MLNISPNKANYFKRGITCFKTKQSFVRTADRNSPLLPLNRSFSQKKALQTNPSVANHAVMPVKGIPAAATVLVRCSMPSVPSAESPAKSHLSRGEIAPSIAAIVSENKPSAYAPLRRRFFIPATALIHSLGPPHNFIFFGDPTIEVILWQKIASSILKKSASKNPMAAPHLQKALLMARVETTRNNPVTAISRGMIKSSLPFG